MAKTVGQFNGHQKAMMRVHSLRANGCVSKCFHLVLSEEGVMRLLTAGQTRTYHVRDSCVELYCNIDCDVVLRLLQQMCAYCMCSYGRILLRIWIVIDGFSSGSFQK